MAEHNAAPQTPGIIMAFGETELKWSDLNGKEQLGLTAPIWQNNVVRRDGGKALQVNLFCSKDAAAIDDSRAL